MTNTGGVPPSAQSFWLSDPLFGGADAFEDGLSRETGVHGFDSSACTPLLAITSRAAAGHF